MNEIHFEGEAFGRDNSIINYIDRNRIDTMVDKNSVHSKLLQDRKEQKETMVTNKLYFVNSEQETKLKVTKISDN